MQIKYKLPISAESANTMLVKVRREAARIKVRSLTADVIRPVCATLFTVCALFGFLSRFSEMADKTCLAAAAKLPFYNKLINFINYTVPTAAKHIIENNMLLWLALAMVLPVAAGVVIAVIIKIVYHPARETSEKSTVRDTAEALYKECEQMCRNDEAVQTKHWASYAATALLTVSAIAEIYFAAWELKAGAEFVRIVWPVLFYILCIGLVGLIGANLSESIGAMLSGVSNRYGASSITKDTYNYWCSVDPRENARRYRGLEADSMKRLAKNRDGENTGLTYALQLMSEGNRLTVLRYLLENEALGMDELEQIIRPADREAFAGELTALEEHGLIKSTENENVKRILYSLTPNGRSLMKSVKSISDWGDKKLEKLNK